MRRVRQESAEMYEVTSYEVARALGLYVVDDDTVTVEHMWEGQYKITVRHHENESVELEAPVCDPFADGTPELLPGQFPAPPLDVLLGFSLTAPEAVE